MQMVRFTPPRERSPPSFNLDQPYKSTQHITFLSSGSSTSARDHTPSGGHNRGTPSAAQPFQSPKHSQPGTPSSSGPLSSQLSWSPAPSEATKVRAQISNEVMEWHARRMSRSVSRDDSQSTSQPMTPSVDPVADDWVFEQQPNHYRHQAQYQNMDDNGYEHQFYNSPDVHRQIMTAPQNNEHSDNGSVICNMNAANYQTYDYTQQPQPQQLSYSDDSHRWDTYDMKTTNADKMCHYAHAPYQTEQQYSMTSPSVEDVQHPVTVKSSATVVFRPASNGL